MTTADGYVGGSVKIVDHGPETSRFNMVVLGDGYRQSELAKYHADVDAFVQTISNTPPFNELWCGINVFRVDVVSTESGADDPTGCPDDGGTGATANTYFDAAFCGIATGGQRMHRVLTVDATSAKNVAHAHVTPTHRTIVIVNSSIYGGSGGDVAVCSTHPLSAKIAIHELGHTFGLADEYEGDGTAGGTGEPMAPNVTRDTNRATNKWRALVAATTPMPSSCYPECGDCTAPTTPPAADEVGTYEGGNYAHCGVYRPLPSCYMRDYSTFCPVCAGVIRQTLTQYLPAEIITLTTPSINFTNVPEGAGGTGVTTYRAIVWEIVACRSLRFRITAGPTGGFGTPLGTVVTIRPSGTTPLQAARIWISYTSTTAGDSRSGSVTVACDETGQSWTIIINANTVARPRSAIALVLDRSGSMSEDAGDGAIKVQKLRDAGSLFVALMQQGDALGLVRFDDTAQRLMDVTDMGPTDSAARAAALAHFTGNELDPAGSTSIGDGVLKGKLALDDAQAAASPRYDTLAMLVLTDGVENTSPLLSAVSSSITANTFAIGLGLPSNISTDALNALTQGRNGYLLVTGALTPDQSFRLSKYFVQVLAGITNANVILDPHGELSAEAEHRIPFQVTEADISIDVILLTAPSREVYFELETPDGQRISGAVGNVELVTGDHYAFYRASLPAIPSDADGSHAGTWYAVLELGRMVPRASRDVVPYNLLVHCRSNVVFKANVAQSGGTPGARVEITATLREYDVPVEGRAQVWADVTRPDGTSFLLPLAAEDAGRYTAAFTAGALGLYTARVRARGETFRGTSFTREQTLTAAIHGEGEGAPPDGGHETFCRIVRCVLGGKVLSTKLLKHLAATGLDLAHLEECLVRECQNLPAELERRGRAEPRAPRIAAPTDKARPRKRRAAR